MELREAIEELEQEWDMGQSEEIRRVAKSVADLRD